MNFAFNIDWKFMVALDIGVLMTIFAVKMDKSEIENVSVLTIDAVKECAIAIKGNI